jgi:hypothetical protein
MATKKSQRINHSGGRFILSDDKIKEFASAGLTSESYIKDVSYYRGIPEHIIINSNIEKISKMDTDYSLYGLIYKITLKEGVQSPLVNINISEDVPDYGNYGKTSCSLNTFFRKKCLKDVRTFLLKVSFLSINDEIPLIQDGDKLTVIKSDFINESNVQNLAYEKTFEFGESVVPACISPPYIDSIEQNKVIHPILTKLISPEVDKDGWLNFLLKSAKRQDVKEFGLIFMEFAEGYKTLRDILEDKFISPQLHKKAIILSKMSHLCLFEKRIAQGDSHNQNIMVNLDYVGFLGEGRKGKALVIDFGRAKTISDSDLTKFGLSKNVKYEEYFQIFNYLRWVSKNRGK